MPSAQIQFSQGMTTTPAGESALGYSTGTQVNFTDAAGGGALSWAWTLVGFPGSLGVAPTVNNAATQTANLTPTVDGVYILQVVRTDPGPVVTTDTRFFAIGDSDYGYVMPSAGMTGLMTNVGGSAAAQAAGWQGRADASTNVFLDGLLRFLRARVGRFVGLVSTVSHSSGSPVTVTITDGTDKPFRILNLTGAGLYTLELDKPTASEGKSFEWKISLTAGAGGLVINNGVSGSSILALTAPGSGTTVWSVKAVFDGTNWLIASVSTALPTVVPFPGVAGVQQTSNTGYTECGAIVFNAAVMAPSDSQLTRTVKFRAVLEISPAGGTAYVRLFNTTDGEAVTSTELSTANTTATKLVSGTLTVGAASGNIKNAEKLYEIQIKRTGGTATDVVTCKLAQLEVQFS